MRDWPPWKWLGLLTLRAPLATGQTSAGPHIRQNTRFTYARQPRPLGCGQRSGRGRPEPGTRVPSIGTLPARSVHIAISGVHNLWTKLLITLGLIRPVGREGRTTNEWNRPCGGLRP